MAGLRAGGGSPGTRRRPDRSHEADPGDGWADIGVKFKKSLSKYNDIFHK